MLHSSLFIVIFGLILTKSNGLHINSESYLTEGETPDTVYPELWISDLFYTVLANFTVHNVGNINCQKQGEMYIKNLRNHTNWAIRMAESWNRYPTGILAGNNHHFGIYDECVGVRYPIKGQYCLSEIKLMPLVGNNHSSNIKENLHRVYNSNSWKTILEWIKYPDQVQRNVLNIGICIPDSCTASDLQTSLQSELNKVFLPEKVSTIVKVDQIMCTVKEDKYPYDTGFYMVCSIFGLIVTLCCGTTIYHFIKLNNNEKNNEANENFSSLIYAFSFIKTLKYLVKYCNEDNQFNGIDATKAIAMLALVFGHIFIVFLGFPKYIANTMEDMYSNELNFFLSGANAVDIFFFLSGLIMVYYIPLFKTPGSLWIKFGYAIIMRIVRMLPAYCAMILITAYIVPHLGDGPLWHQKIWEEADNCKNYWWANLLFINNFIDVKHQCLIVSWYLTCDIHLYVVGVIILCVYAKNDKYGIRLLITIFGLSLLVPFIVTFLKKSEGILKYEISFIQDPRSSTTFNEIYRSSYMRGGPYFLGLIVGLVVEKMKKEQIKLSQIVVYGGTLFMTVISVWIHLYGNTFYARKKSYNPLEHALYFILNHFTWPLLLVCTTICHFTTGFGPLVNIFVNRFTVVLGRMSYSIMLVNLTVTMVSQVSNRFSNHFSTKSVIDLLIYEAFKCYFMSLMFYLIVEAPFDIILKRLLGPRKQKTSNTNGISSANQNNTGAKETVLVISKTQSEALNIINKLNDEKASGFDMWNE